MAWLVEVLSTLQLTSHPILALLVIPLTTLAYLLLNEFVRYRARNHEFGGPGNRILVGNLPDIAVNAPERFRKWANSTLR